MAGHWEGFTEEDIDFYLGSHEEQEKRPAPKREAHKLQGRREKNVRGIRTVRNRPEEGEGNLPDGARLSSTEMKPLIEEENQPTILTSHPVCLKVTEGNGYEVVDKTVSTATLEVFQARQKVLEEQNKKQKELLARVLDDRRKQTSEEAKRLKSIQEELHKLDVMLSNDVEILRDQIECAAMEFGEAQKRYNKAEKEYLEAKQSLFTKLERKELLTRHLCTIIEQNEMRKAKKLSELMDKLSVNDNKTETKAVILSPYNESAFKNANEKEESSPPGKVNSGYSPEEPAETCS